MNTVRNLIDAAKEIQPHLVKFAGEGIDRPREASFGARVWISEHHSLHAMVWTPSAEGMGPAERQDMVWKHMRSLPRSVFRDLGKISMLTPEEYEELYFFTRPPFCDPELA